MQNRYNEESDYGSKDNNSVEGERDYDDGDEDYNLPSFNSQHPSKIRTLASQHQSIPRKVHNRKKGESFSHRNQPESARGSGDKKSKLGGL